MSEKPELETENTNLSLDLTQHKDQSSCFLVFHYCGAPTSEDYYSVLLYENEHTISRFERDRESLAVPGLRLVCKVITHRDYSLWK